MQTQPQTQPQTQATFTMPHKPHRLIPSDRVEGTAVRRSDGTKVGTIQRLMIDKVGGKIAYAVLSFGSFMGIGAKHIPVPWVRMKYSASLDAYEINVIDEELSRAPSYEADKEFDWGNRDDELMIHDYYRKPPYWGA
jgi:sporulation protein YlmC with PRC-barrel domain